MRTHTSTYKQNISQFGREIDSKITYTLNNQNIELGADELNSISRTFDSTILKSVMRKLEIDSNVEIPINTIVNFQFGTKVNETIEYLNYGNYIVYSVEKQEDLNSYKIVCYDKMLNAMKDYKEVATIYPCTIREYMIELCDTLNLTFKNSTDTFVNYDKPVPSDLYKGLGYTYRDVLDQLAEVTASTICINEDDDELEIRYINYTESKNKFNLDKIYKGTWRSNYVKTQKIDTGLKLTCLQSGTQRWKPVYILDNSFLGKTITLSSKITDNNSQKGKMAFYWVNMDNLVYAGLVGIVEGTGTDKELTLTITLPNELPQGQTNLAIFLYSGVTQTNVDDYVLYKDLMIEINPTKTDFEPAGDTINEEFLKDVNVNFGKKYGPVNSIVLSRAGESDNVYLRDETSVTQNGLCEIKIIENQIMNFNNRADFLQGILNQLDGLEYYINDFASTGITYFDVCDQYNIQISDKYYRCIMFNDEINITQGLEENIYTEMPEDSETDYKKADKTDRRINRAYAIVDKQNQTIEQLTSTIENVDKKANNTYQEVINKIGDMDEKIVDIDSIEYVVRQLQTSTYTKEEIQQIVNGTGVDGVVVQAVVTTSATFNEDGMLYEKTNAPSKTQINQNGINVKNQNNQSILFAGYVDSNNTDYPDYVSQSIVGTDNIIVKNYLNVGTHSRIQDYNNGTGIFYID